MFKGLYVDKPESVVVLEEQEADLQANQVRIQTEFAAIKHGTEFHLFSGKSPHAEQRFDADLRLFVPVSEQERSQASGRRSSVGNMAVGCVIEIGKAVTKVKPGDRVYCYGPAWELLTKEETDVEPLFEPMSPQDAVCLDPALYAFTAVRDARARLGDTAVVFGLGAIGLFVVQMLKMSGCLHVVAVDPIEKRRTLAERYGANLTLDPTQCDVGLEVRKVLGQGADIAIEASGHYKALSGAMRAVRNCGRIVTLGYYKGRDSELELGAEWHHNRLELIGSMPVWDNPLRDYPLWDNERISRTLIELFRQKRLISDGIVDPIVDFEDAAAAFLAIYRNPANAIKLGIRF
ncbi:zinc-dependent alcohol dehydrogenase [Dictyobacter formicarum]|uniref:Alcohol dehydrogenase n=1 Tax=Dictyobacter formicarum TaxID=2778368 RepID=A0ABQ3VDF3_9CHLR|nr:zinc-binding dehydrogenase [Dictyobacter formicarum]GHO83191.1 alcohol dehydrogenase [Dictyobacter formicarum]